MDSRRTVAAPKYPGKMAARSRSSISESTVNEGMGAPCPERCHTVLSEVSWQSRSTTLSIRGMPVVVISCFVFMAKSWKIFGCALFAGAVRGPLAGIWKFVLPYMELPPAAMVNQHHYS